MLDDSIVRMRIAMPMEAKISWAKARIRQWIDHYDGKVHVAFSGGKDSIALLHLVRQIDKSVPAVFCAEPTYPEVMAIVRETPNVTIIRPKKKLPEIIERWGYPVISKEVAQFAGESRSAGVGSQTYRLRTTGFNTAGKFSKRAKLPLCWLKLLNAPFKVSDHCCKINKKQPSAIYMKAAGTFPIVGTTASESRRRMLTYKKFGCNGYDLKIPRSTPIAIWTDSDVWEYIRQNNLKYPEVYDMGHTRTGCMVCGFGCHMRKPNQFQLLRETHPKVWRWAMGPLGWARVLEWLDIPSGNEPVQREMFPLIEAATPPRSPAHEMPGVQREQPPTNGCTMRYCRCDPRGAFHPTRRGG